MRSMKGAACAYRDHVHQSRCDVVKVLLATMAAAFPQPENKIFG